MIQNNPKRRLFDQWKIANPWHRLAAQVIDQSLVGFATGFVLNFWFSDKIWTEEWWVAWLLLWPFISLSAQCFCLLYFGTTPGKKPFGIVVKSANPTRELTPWQILTRSCSWWMGALTLGAGWSTIISRGDRRGWHDIIAETIVVNPVADAHRPSQFERAFGHLWIVAVSMFFISLLSWGLVFQLKHLSKLNDLGHTHVNDGTPIEKLSWSMLLKNELVVPSNLGLSPEETKVADVMRHYSLSFDTVESEKETYYKLNVEPSVKEICKNNERSSHCQTVKLVSQFIKNENAEETGPLVPEALEVLAGTKTMNVKAAAEFFAKQALTAPLHSVEYLVSKTRQAQALISLGKFARAAQVLQPDVVFFSHTKQGLGEIMNASPDSSHFSLEILAAQNLIQTACQASALNSCQSETIAQCTQINAFNDWTQGCQMNIVPKTYSSVAQGLGYWWSQAQLPSVRFQKKFKNLDTWDSFRDRFRKRKLSAMEKEIFDSLHFVLAVKSSSPEDVLEKADVLHEDGILFGWAHEVALKEFGAQWLAILSFPTRDKLARYDLTNPTQPAEVVKTQLASTEEPAPAPVVQPEDPPRKPSSKKKSKKKKSKRK